MPVTALVLGQVQTLTQNTVYALPPTRCLLMTDGAAPTLVQSTDFAFTLSVAVTLTGGQAELAGGFLKLTSATPINVWLKRS